MGQGIFKISNLRKTYGYLRKNGVKSAYYAALERIMSAKDTSYCYAQPETDVLAKQREMDGAYPYRFSILVPAYETRAEYLRKMVDSVLEQSYGNLELIIADASYSKRVKEVVDTYKDERIRYIPLKENKGISENTNRALEAAQGDYIGLLDHDDVLTPDALYEMANAIYRKEKSGGMAWLLYSDEDKGNGELTVFDEPHFKPELNVDLLLSNNYICHFMVMKRELMQELRFRGTYDGAQDYDLVLRAVGRLLYERGTNGGMRAGRDTVIHIPRVLYHWRCHSSSTAENPGSKRYAYEAGKRALEDFLRARGWNGIVSHTKHLGFYRIDYGKDILEERREVGVVAGRILDHRGKICGGAFGENGNVLYAGLYKNFSGYMHRATLRQEVYAADIRRMRVRKELWNVFEEVFGAPYQENREGWLDCAALEMQRSERKGQMAGISQEHIKQCLEFGRRVREKGYTIVWLPEDAAQSGEQNMEVTVVIPNYKGIKYIESCLDSLYQGSLVPDIIVVDNGSKDGSAELVAQKHPDCRLVRFKENKGFCAAVNAGIRLSQTEYVILLNNDTEVDKDFVKNLYRAIKKRKRAFSVSAKMLSLHQPEIIDDAGDLYCSLGWAFALGKGKTRTAYNKETKVFAACGGAAVYRKNVFETIGYFDENHFAYLEDIDIGYRARISGFYNYYAPEAIVYHAGSAVSGSRYNDFKVRLASCNSIYLIYKNMPLFQILLNLPFLMVGIGIKALFFMKKGMGRAYLKGIAEGICLSFSKEGRKQKVPFRLECLGNYTKIQLELWWNMVRRIVG